MSAYDTAREALSNAETHLRPHHEPQGSLQRATILASLAVAESLSDLRDEVRAVGDAIRNLRADLLLEGKKK